MSWFHSRPPCEKARRCAPRLETLEDRCTPAVTFNVSGDTLFITGDAGNNLILVRDTGDGSIGNITVQTEDGLMTPAPASAIKRIVVDAQAGNDSVGYTVTNNFNSEMTFEATLGDGNDILDVQMRQILANARLNFIANGNNGNDSLIGQFNGTLQNGAQLNWTMSGDAGNDRATMALIGNLLANARLNSNVNLGAGDDTWAALFQGTYFGGALATINALGDAGNDVIGSTFNTSHLGGSRTRINYQGGIGFDLLGIYAGPNTDVEAGGEWTVQFDGGADADNVFLLHFGRVNGVVDALLDGGTGNDSVRGLQVLSNGSNPTRNTNVWRVNGGVGNDRLMLHIFPWMMFPSSQVNGRIDGGSGLDMCRKTPNVLASGCER